MDKSPVTPCPDAEILAAWLDHGLDDRERAGITAHVAGCDDCRTIVANVLKFQDATSEAATGQPENGRTDAPLPLVSTPESLPVRGRRKIVWAGSVLAAAAAVIIAVNLQPARVDRWRADRRLADLAQAANGQRTVEARLTGGFAYGPLRAPVRSGGSTAGKDNWSLLAAAGKIREEADKSPVAANLHGLGLAALVLGEHDEAIRALEDATSEEPASGRYQSDLAAAYLSRAQAADRPDDLTRGLTAAERALKADHNLLEARFNRALALERLYLTDQARKAWQEYLEYDPGSPWSEEARQHLQAIPEVQTKDDQTKNNSPPEVTETTVEAALEWLLRKDLPTWADAVLAKDLQTAQSQRTRLTERAEAITSASGDPFAVAIVRSLQPNPSLAEGVRRFSLALRALSGDNYQAAEPELTQACPLIGEPLRSLCYLELGAITALRQQGADSETRVASARSIADEQGFAYLRGSALRLEGWRLLVAGRTAPSLQPYLSAYQAFDQGHYPVHAGLMADQIANLFDMQGLVYEAWRWRLVSLKLAAATNDRHLAHVTRVSASGLLRKHGAAEAALTFAEAVGLPDPSALSPLQRVSRERQRLAALLALGDPSAAGITIDTIDQALTGVSDFRAKLLRPYLMILRANVAMAKGADDIAESALDGALSSMSAVHVSERISALLARGRVRTHRSRNAEAETDVREAIRLLVDRAPASSAQPMQLYDAQAALDAVSSLVLARADLQSARGLVLLEQLREVLDGTATGQRIRSVAALEQQLTKVRPEQSLVYYLFSDEGRLLAWVASPGNISFVTLPATTSDISRLVNLLAVQVTRAPARQDEWRATLTKLHELLIGGLPSLGRDLIIVPDGILNRVPFGSLVDPRSRQFLFEGRTVRLAPNLALALTEPRTEGDNRSSPASPSALVIGEPALGGGGARAFDRLPAAKSEAKVVAHLYESSTLLVGADATRERVLRALPSSDILHFAGHALMTPDGREGARLLLTGAVEDPSTALRIGDASQQGPRVPASVVLAACGTAATSVDRSSGVASLAASFLRAGSRSVVGTLWPVEDGASQEFFISLHRRLAAGDNMAAAVARAQQTCLASASCRKSVATWVGTAAYGSS